MPTSEDAIKFYEENYDVLGSWMLRPGEKIMLGDKENRVCRFCGKTTPEVQFRKDAHAVSEMLGNKSLFTAYECDTCNGDFGKGIEQDLGNWSKPMRTMARIRGKSGVLTLKRGGDTGWRIECDDARTFEIKDYEADPVTAIDEEKKSISFKLKRDPYTPVGVMKAFVKMGLTLLPAEELPNFRHALAWIKDKNHRRRFANDLPVFYAFQPGPMPNDLIAAIVLRLKNGVTGLPYAFFVLGYGNEVFQFVLPTKKDKGIDGKRMDLMTFPTPGSPDPLRFPMTGRAVLNLGGTEVIKGETYPITMGFDAINWTKPDGTPSAPPS